jgi:hypothetical protein
MVIGLSLACQVLELGWIVFLSTVSKPLSCLVSHSKGPIVLSVDHVSDDDVYLNIFEDSYAAIQTHVRSPDGFIVGSPQSPHNVLISLVPPSPFPLAPERESQHNRLSFSLLTRYASPGWRY